MKNSFKRFSVFYVAVILTITVSCGSQPENMSEPEKSGSTEIVYAIWDSPDVKEQRMIDEFNNSDNGYKLTVKDYSEYLVAEPDDENVFTSDSITAMNIRITKDITDGKIDIVSDHSFADPVYYEKLLKQGTFTDMYSFMESDSDINTETLNKHILSLHETDGKLCTLPVCYSINTLAGKSRYVGDKENWTLDELIAHWNAMPAGAVINGKTEKNYVYYTVLRDTLGEYVDYKNAKVSFDSGSFKKAVEFCNLFEPVSDYKSEENTDNINFIELVTLYGFDSFHLELYNDSNERVTFAGYPSDNFRGSFINSTGSRFSICSSSSEARQNGAWQFIRTLASEKYQTDCYIDYYEEEDCYSDEHGFPINNAVFDEIADEAENGKFTESTRSFCGIEKEVGYLTDEELNRLKKFIDNINAVYVQLDRDLDEIIESEVMSYFNGEKSVDEAVNMIQNRASIMVNEKN